MHVDRSELIACINADLEAGGVREVRHAPEQCSTEFLVEWVSRIVARADGKTPEPPCKIEGLPKRRPVRRFNPQVQK